MARDGAEQPTPPHLAAVDAWVASHAVVGRVRIAGAWDLLVGGAWLLVGGGLFAVLIGGLGVPGPRPLAFVATAGAACVLAIGGSACVLYGGIGMRRATGVRAAADVARNLRIATLGHALLVVPALVFGIPAAAGSVILLVEGVCCAAPLAVAIVAPAGLVIWHWRLGLAYPRAVQGILEGQAAVLPGATPGDA